MQSWKMTDQIARLENDSHNSRLIGQDSSINSIQTLR